MDYNWNQHFVCTGESHDFWEIVYVMSGAVECTEDERIYRLTEGNMVLHAPMEFHKIRSADGTSPHVLVLSFESTGQLPVSLGEGVFLLSPQEREEYESIFRRVYALRGGQAKGQFAAQECADSMASFLVRLSEAHSARTQLSHSRDAQMYQWLVTLMTERVSDNLVLEELAAQIPVSISYMKVLFRRYAGIGPKTYYSRLRCTEAIRLLRSGLSAAETAERMNFSSPSYFSVFFKKMTGMTPSEYLRQERKC